MQNIVNYRSRFVDVQATMVLLVVLAHLLMARGVRAASAQVALTDSGNKLLARYADGLAGLRTRLADQLPRIDSQSRDAFLRAYAAEAAAKAALDRANASADKAGASKGAAQKQSASQVAHGAQLAYVRAQANTLAAARPILADVNQFLASDSLDTPLIRCAILTDATPRGLAAFAQTGSSQAELVQELLDNDELMKQMLLADGARDGRYGQAMEIYTGIRRASRHLDKPILARLAVGTSLELAGVTEPGDGGATVIDPVPRYLDYEKAYIAGELDPAFDRMSTWECRYITNDPATDKELDWGRQMLRNYRPDLIFEPDYRWRYVRIVRLDVHYQQFEIDPSAPTSRMQQFLDGGGKCGPRAFVGRFILRSFGIPTWGVRQVGHAALSHWTPAGWTVNFGAAWEHNWWDDRPGPDFLLETQARQHPDEYMKVLRAQWVGDALGEAKVEPMRPGTGGLWNALALMEKKAIVSGAKPVEVPLAGAELAESNISNEAETVLSTPIAPDDKKVSISRGGVITIPAVACSKPQRSTPSVDFMKSFGGGMQVYLQSTTPVEYTLAVPTSGRYTLTARVVTLHEDLHLVISSSAEPVPRAVAVPYTVGMWEETQPVQISLVRGQNIFRVAQDVAKYGMTIKQFTLRPVD